MIESRSPPKPKPPYPSGLYTLWMLAVLAGVVWISLSGGMTFRDLLWYLAICWFFNTLEVAFYTEDDDPDDPTKGTKSEATDAYFNKIGRAKLATAAPQGERPHHAPTKEGQ